MPDFWEQWDTNPNLNTLPPPDGAPEGMKAGRANDVLREVMSACRQLGNRIGALVGPPPTGAVATLKGMAYQEPNAVAITGGTVAGNGAGLTALDAAQLATGRVPNGRLSGSYDISITGNAATATALTGSGLDAVLPPGSIILWYGDSAHLPAGWKLCDGTLGTPNMIGAVPIGAHAVNDPVGTRHGTGNLTLAAAPTHSHAGSSAAAVALTVAQMPLHGHAFFAAKDNQGSAQTDPTGGLVSSESTGTQGIEVENTGAPTNTKRIGGTGGGGTHSHALTVTADGGHTHTGTDDPVRVGLHFLMRA